MTKISIRSLLPSVLSIILLSGCSTVKSLFSGDKRKKQPVTEIVEQKPAGTIPIDSFQKRESVLLSPADGEIASLSEPLPLTGSKNRPKMTFGEVESANVRIPLKYNNPFSDAGELVLPMYEFSDQFCYPYEGKVISPFGYRGRRMHTGMDIKAIPNDTIRAALPGVVRMSKYYSGYGNLVLIRHYNGIETLYGHNSKNLVQVNDVVEAGDPIALAGRTGRATTEHVHFEVRVAGEPLNPNLFVDPDSHSLRCDRTLYCYNRGGQIRVSTKKATGFMPDEQTADGEEIAALPAGGVPSGPSAPAASRSSSSASSAAASSKQYYYVKKGDTLSKIAREHSTTVAKLCSLNGIKSTKILQIKEKLRVR